MAFSFFFLSFVMFQASVNWLINQDTPVAPASLVSDPPSGFGGHTAAIQPPVVSRLGKTDAQRNADQSFQQRQRERLEVDLRLRRAQDRRERELLKQQIADDRAAHRQRGQGSTGAGCTAIAKSTAQPPAPSADGAAVVLVRLPAGQTMRYSCSLDTPLGSVWDAARSAAGTEVLLLSPFPRREFGPVDQVATLAALGLGRRCILVAQAAAASITRSEASYADLPTPAPTSAFLPNAFGGPTPLAYGESGDEDTDDEEDQPPWGAAMLPGAAVAGRCTLGAFA